MRRKTKLATTRSQARELGEARRRLPRRLPTVRLPRGTRLYRVHDTAIACDTFLGAATDPADPRRGGRFDPLPGETVDVLYAASSADAALAESLIEIDARGAWRASSDLNGRALSRLALRRTLTLVAYRGLALGHFPVRELATHGKDDYPRARAWARAMRERAPRAQGIVWVSRQDNSAFSYVFWRDRLRPRDLEPEGRAIRLASRAGRAKVTAVFRRSGVKASRPARAKRS